MCGFSGFCSLPGTHLLSEEDCRKVLQNMNDTLYHRGPDSQGIFLDSHTGLAHTRLAIIDPLHGLQPMTKKLGGHSFTICYNGELYNANELRKDLYAHGISTETTSDTEVILSGFLLYGPSFVDRLDGIFAFAIWDSRHEICYLFRDSFGIKPLFYTLKNNTLIFSSEPKGIFCYPGVTPAVDREGLCEIFGLGPARNPGCGIFHNLSECLPGHYISYSAAGLRQHCYFRLQSRPHEDDYETTLERTRELAISAIERQMVSDVPICTFLSGGLDSSLVSAVCAAKLKEQGKTLDTYSFDFVDNQQFFEANDFQPSMDRPFVDIMVEHINSNHTYLECDNRSQADLLFSSVKAHDLPCMADIDSSLLYFCREVSRRHKVVLTGECADEVFGGYPWFHREEFLHCGTFPWTPKLDFRTSFLRPEIREQLCLEDYVQDSYRRAISEIDILPEDNETEQNRRRISYLNIRYFMQTLLNRMDRTSMNSGLEARVPFADRALVSYVFNIPWEMKAHDGLVKNLLRQASKDYLPEEIAFRRKSPYPKTYHPYYEQLLNKRLRQIVETGTSPLLQFIDRKYTLDFLAHSHDYGRPWYGQLMAGPQMTAYLLQIHYWLSEYCVRILL